MIVIYCVCVWTINTRQEGFFNKTWKKKRVLDQPAPATCDLEMIRMKSVEIGGCRFLGNGELFDQTVSKQLWLDHMKELRCE